MVLSLEGGYELAPISDAAEECVRSLMSKPPANPSQMNEYLYRGLRPEALSLPPILTAQECLQKVVAIQKMYWHGLRAEHIGKSHLEFLAGVDRNEVNNSELSMETV